MGHPRLQVLQQTPLSLPASPQSDAPVDPYGRHIDYLRISITDRCNLRCVYCMPAKGVTLQPRDHLLTHAEIVRLVGAAHSLGFRKFRVTGGEPLVVRHVLDLLAALRRATPGALLCLTTNGVHLQSMAAAIRSAGVQRLNISIDTLRPDRFAAMTRRNELDAVLRGIEAALDAGFERVKLNAVVVRGVNDDEVADLAGLAARWPLDVRFIEQMPLDSQPDGGFLGTDAIVARLRTIYPALRPVAPDDPRAAAQQLLTHPGWAGRLGFIAPRSRKFCNTCNRMRLTPNGELKGCLLREGTLDVRRALRAMASDAELRGLLLQAVSAKPREYVDDGYGLDRPMSSLGG